MNAMEIRGLCKRYPAFELKNVTFSVPQGAVMGFIGRNGAGKSTTIKSILGLVHLDAGHVEIMGKDFAGNERFIKENIGVVLGGIDFYPKKKIRILTDVTRRFYENWDEDKYRHYLRLFAIDEEKRVDQLSSGMQVKYMVALALSHNAKLLILDEPTSGLDPVSRDELTELLRKIAADGQRSVLFPTPRFSSTIIFFRSISLRKPSPPHSGQAPYGLLKENSLGSSSSMLTSQSGQLYFVL